jgi:hypothetical protein
MSKLLKKQGIVPDEWVTGKNPSYGAVLRELKLNNTAHTRRKRAGLVTLWIMAADELRLGPFQAATPAASRRTSNASGRKRR